MCPSCLPWFFLYSYQKNQVLIMFPFPHFPSSFCFICSNQATTSTVSRHAATFPSLIGWLWQLDSWELSNPTKLSRYGESTRNTYFCHRKLCFKYRSQVSDHGGITYCFFHRFVVFNMDLRWCKISENSIVSSPIIQSLGWQSSWATRPYANLVSVSKKMGTTLTSSRKRQEF